MNRRRLLQAGLAAGGAMVHAQDAGATTYLNPETGADTNPGSRDKPLRTLAAAAQRVNATTGSGAVTVVLIELDQAKRDYLHVVAGRPGSEIAAGLFIKRV